MYIFDIDKILSIYFKNTFKYVYFHILYGHIYIEILKIYKYV